MFTAAGQKDIRPIVCASAGNWGLALAWSCKKQHRPLTVFVSQNANQLKVNKIKSLGAQIMVFGDDFDSAKKQAKKYSLDHDYVFLEDGKEVSVSEGAGSIGIELVKSGIYFDEVYIPLGNGALVGGVARWIKSSSPSTKIIAVVPEGADSMYASWKQSKLIIRNFVDTVADGLAVRVPIPEAVEDIQTLVDEMVLVTDQQILKAMNDAEENDDIVLEPSGAAGIAGVMAMSKERKLNGNITIILTGSNRA